MREAFSEKGACETQRTRRSQPPRQKAQQTQSPRACLRNRKGLVPTKVGVRENVRVPAGRGEELGLKCDTLEMLKLGRDGI